MQHRKIFPIMIICFFLLSSHAYSSTNIRKYQLRAGQMLTNTMYDDADCKTRVKWLSKYILRDTDNFHVVVGKYKGRGHIWIEIDGVIIDPSIYNSDSKHYKMKFKVKGKTFYWTNDKIILKNNGNKK